MFASLRLIFCLSLLGLVGCTSFQTPLTPTPKLTGTWENRLGSQWKLNSDGSFEIKHGGHLRVTGTYGFGNWPKKNEMTVLYTGGSIPWDGHEPAIYRVKRDTKTIRFIGVDDTCAVRIADLSVKWKKKN